MEATPAEPQRAGTGWGSSPRLRPGPLDLLRAEWELLRAGFGLRCLPEGRMVALEPGGVAASGPTMEGGREEAGGAVTAGGLLRRDDAGEASRHGAAPGASGEGHARDVPRGGLPARALRLQRAVHLAARYGPYRPTCLVRALALRRLLRSRGFGDVTVKVGVRRVESGIEAHAWVARGEVPICDDPGEVEGFTELRGLSVDGLRGPGVGKRLR